MKELIKLVLSVLLLLCLAPMPYGFYELVRTAAMIGFAFLAYQTYKEDKQSELIIYVGLAILFQPIFKIALGRTLWNVVDVVVAVGLLISIFKSKKTN